jgi:hypothetical protein
MVGGEWVIDKEFDFPDISFTTYEEMNLSSNDELMIDCWCEQFS